MIRCRHDQLVCLSVKLRGNATWWGNQKRHPDPSMESDIVPASLSQTYSPRCILFLCFSFAASVKSAMSHFAPTNTFLWSWSLPFHCVSSLALHFWQVHYIEDFIVLYRLGSFIHSSQWRTIWQVQHSRKPIVLLKMENFHSLRPATNTLALFVRNDSRSCIFGYNIQICQFSCQNWTLMSFVLCCRLHNIDCEALNINFPFSRSHNLTKDGALWDGNFSIYRGTSRPGLRNLQKCILIFQLACSELFRRSRLLCGLSAIRETWYLCTHSLISTSLPWRVDQPFRRAQSRRRLAANIYCFILFCYLKLTGLLL